MKFKSENLIIWQKAMVLGEDIFQMTHSFPSEEKFNLTSQSCRAADSIALNISEGSIDQSNPEQKHFMGYAIRSQAEVVTCLYKSKNRDYISKDTFSNLYSKSFDLMNMMIAFKNQLN